MRHSAFASLFALLLVRVTLTFDDSLPRSFLSLDLLSLRDDALVTGNRRQLEVKHAASSSSKSEFRPLFEGMGTHYSYIYVGT